jgi:hypothetical protein
MGRFLRYRHLSAEFIIEPQPQNHSPNHSDEYRPQSSLEPWEQKSQLNPRCVFTRKDDRKETQETQN